MHGATSAVHGEALLGEASKKYRPPEVGVDGGQEVKELRRECLTLVGEAA